ncbi:MAG: hypothetical protein K8R79_10025 [Calditrichales bacterium]|nr:hypothetical protein [Calditrichales bacterium]
MYTKVQQICLKIIVIVLTLLFTTSCGSNKEKIIIWSSLRPLERNLLDTLLHKFSTGYPQYDFGQLFYAPEEARTNFIISSLAGKGPALLHGASDNIGPFVELDVIQPMEALFDSSYLAGFLMQPIEANSWFQSRLYQIADRIGNHLCLVYNKDIIPQPPKTISELIEMGN